MSLLTVQISKRPTSHYNPFVGDILDRENEEDLERLLQLRKKDILNFLCLNGFGAHSLKKTPAFQSTDSILLRRDLVL